MLDHRSFHQILALLLVFHQTQLGAQQICSRSCKSTNQSAAFLRPATNVSVADQVDHAARRKTGNIDQNLQRNNVAQQVEGFCITYFAAFRDLKGKNNYECERRQNLFT